MGERRGAHTRHLTPLLQRDARRLARARGRSYLVAAGRDHEAARREKYDVGDRRTFFSRSVASLTDWTRVEAELVHVGAGFAIWLELDARPLLEGTTHGLALVDSVAAYLGQRHGPYAAQHRGGILSVVEQHFGTPPDVDGDGQLDVLLLDIRDGYGGSGAYVAGFFDPVDLTDEPFSNRADLLHIDVWPTLVDEAGVRVEEAAATVAHEYQHLIHARYGGVDREFTFVNEGLSELAEILCGFAPRPADSYFDDPLRPLFSWNYDDPLPDYARASLFFHYLFEQIGSDHVRTLVTSPATGLAGIEEMLHSIGPRTFGELFGDWGRALLLGDDARHGYDHPARRGLRMEPLTVENALPSTLALRMPRLSHLVVDFPLTRRLSVRASAPAGLDLRGAARYPDGTTTLLEGVRWGDELQADAMPHGGIKLAVSNHERSDVEVDTVRHEASFLFTGVSSGRPQTLAYDDGRPDAFSGQAAYLLLDGPDEALALAFGPDEASWLRAVAVKVVFSNELRGTTLPPSADRDLVLEVRRFEDGRSGALLTEPIHVDARRPLGNLRMETFALASRHADLQAVADSFCVVVRNDADDTNFAAIAMDRNAAGRSSRLTPEAGWQTMQHVVVQGEPLTGFHPMIRTYAVRSQPAVTPFHPAASFDHDFGVVRLALPAPFLIDTARTRLVVTAPSGRFYGGQVEAGDAGDPGVLRLSFPVETAGRYEIDLSLASLDGSERREGSYSWTLPAAFDVASPYPNPSTDAVRLPLRVYEPLALRLSVYDLLGRRVYRGPRRSYAPGAEELVMNLEHLAAGPYFVRLEPDLSASQTSGTVVKIAIIR